jgi:hypothetical protein
MQSYYTGLVIGPPTLRFLAGAQKQNVLIFTDLKANCILQKSEQLNFTKSNVCGVSV